MAFKNCCAAFDSNRRKNDKKSTTKVQTLYWIDIHVRTLDFFMERSKDNIITSTQKKREKSLEALLGHVLRKNDVSTNIGNHII